jgi:hypothetical protein
MTTQTDAYREYIRLVSITDERAPYFYEWLSDKGTYRKVIWADVFSNEEKRQQLLEQRKKKEAEMRWAELERSIQESEKMKTEYIDIGENLH